uniref:Wax synthase domain-containing protein n=3 Tax=Triticinae TaxID=1648030 RepID=A0A453C821_AEGTS
RMAGGDLRSLAAVSAAVTAAMCYVRFAAGRLRPGLPRLAAFLPVLAALLFLPFAFRAIHPRAISGFFLAWLAEFKLLRLAAGQGPLHPSLPLPAFVAVASGPVRLRGDGPDKAQGTSSGLDLASSAVMAALLAVIVSLYRYQEVMNQYVLLTLYAFHVYLALELVLASAAAAARALLGMDLEPQFDRPYLSASLRDFWGRRWNLSVPAVLRPCVYRPVRARLGQPAGVLATFLVSGLVHELMFYYITLRPPTGEATAFFALHGACAVAEAWWARHEAWWRPPRLVATPLTLAFVLVTAFWLFFPPITRPGADKLVIAECEAAVAFVRDAGAWAAGSVRSVWTGRS